MRKTNSKFLTCLAMTAAALCVFSAQAQLATPIFGYTDQTWRYYQAGDQPANNNGSDWKGTNYDDSAWTAGNGTFAYEPDTPQNYPLINTFLDRNTAGGAQIITYYFRTHFTFSGNPANAILYFTNIVDDGCVVYLNGFEMYRIRMPGGTVNATTPASGTGTEGALELNTITSSPRLRQGDNVIAVELHDTTGSSDVAWTLGLGYALPEPIVITKQPPSSLAVVEFDDPALSVEVTGTNPRYWWFANNTYLTNQTNATLSRPNISQSQAGTYYCVISNSVGGVRSSNCVVSVVRDTFGPRLQDAYVAIGDTNRLFLQFNEDIMRFPGAANTNRSGANPTNYWITLMNSSTRLVVTQAVVGVGNGQVRLTLNTNFNFATNYMLCISNICDVRTNAIAWNSCVPIGYQATTNPIPYRSYWSYNEWGQPLDDTNWTDLTYQEDPARWFDGGSGLFFYSITRTNAAGQCTDQGWTMSTGAQTYYFRRKFDVPTNLVGIVVDTTINHVVNDGAIFYLNGKEVARFNMPAGPTTFFTKTTANMTEACRSNVVTDVVLARTNILAVEVHQSGDSGLNDFDHAFDASLDLKYITYPRFTQPTNIRLFATNFSPTQVKVYFTNGFGYAIQSKTNLTDPWQEVQPISNQLIVPKATRTRQFYRLQKSH